MQGSNLVDYVQADNLLGLLGDDQLEDVVSSNDLIEMVAQRMGEGAGKYDAMQMLWNQNHPWVIWLILGGIGLASVFGMTILYLKTRRT